MWDPTKHGDQDNLTWAWLRAVEWQHWPLFLSQPIVPVLLYFYPWVWVLGAMVVVSLLWTVCIVPYIVSPVLSYVGPLIVMAKFLTAPLVAFALWRNGQIEIAALALLWPFLGPLIVGWLLIIPEAALSPTSLGKHGQTGAVQRRLMERLAA